MLNIGPCDSNPCKNNGECSVDLATCKPQCKCKPCYEGPYCMACKYNMLLLMLKEYILLEYFQSWYNVRRIANVHWQQSAK